MTGGAFLTRWFQKLRPLAPNLLLNGRSKTFHFALYPCQERLYDKDYNLIQMWTMYPNRQQAVAPGKCFSTDVVSSDKDGVVTVTLKNIQNPTVPTEEILQDEMLYKWKN